MKTIRVLYYADSLGMARPELKVGFEDRYIELIRDYWRQKKLVVEMYDRSRGGLTLANLYDWYKQDINYIEKPVDVLIIQAGVVDCAPRPIPNRVKNLISNLPLFFKKRIIAFLHNNRSKIFRSGIKFYLTTPKLFNSIVLNWIKSSHTIADRVYIFTIAPCTSNIEAHSPGLMESINFYNDLIKKAVSEATNKNIFLIDIHQMIIDSGKPVDEFISSNDGYHINVNGNKLYAEALTQLENKIK